MSSIRNQYAYYKQWWNLQKQPALSAELAPLPKLDQAWLIGILNDPLLKERWQNASTQTDLLHFPSQSKAINPGDQRALFYLVLASKAQRILEIGTHIGHTFTKSTE